MFLRLEEEIIKMKIVCGLDEAGRGALIGPMVIAGVSIDKRHEKKLVEMGVKDSKALSPRRREELYELIEDVAKDIIVMKVQACKIDAYRARGVNLDKIEAMKMAEIIDMMKASVYYVDSLEQNSKKFEELIRSFMRKKKAKLVVKNYLDESVPVVSAASIIAKVERDAEIRKIEKKVGMKIGVGYSHDPRTIEFLKRLIEKRGKNLPPYVRKTWITTQVLLDELKQRKIKDFILRKDKK